MAYDAVRSRHFDTTGKKRVRETEQVFWENNDRQGESRPCKLKNLQGPFFNRQAGLRLLHDNGHAGGMGCKLGRIHALYRADAV